MAKAQKVKPKMTKEERRVKYTKQARDRRDVASKRKSGWNKICFHCRRKGHVTADCPETEKEQSSNQIDRRNIQICYKCGSDEHGLKKCPKLTSEEKNDAKSGRMDYNKMDLPYATCFICKEKGHLSSQCEENKNGVYVKGGSCKICGSIYHLHVNCPEKKKKMVEESSDDYDSAGDVDEYLEDEVENSVTTKDTSDLKPKKKKVVNF